MEEIMIKSDRLVKKKVKIANQETATSTTRCDKPIKNEPPGSSEKSNIITSKRIRMKTDMYIPPPSMFARKVKEEDESQSNRLMNTSSISAVGKQQHKEVKAKKKINTKKTARSIMPRRRIATPKRKTATEVTTRKSFKEGEHVWVKQGKGSHAAVVVSCGTKKATIRWSTMNNLVCDVKVKDLLPMFDEKEGGACSNRKRDRKQTDMYAPPPPKPSKKIKLQELSSDTVDTRAKDSKGKMTSKKRIKEEIETSEFVMQMFGTTKVPSGSAPGPGWVSKMHIRKGKVRIGKADCRRWVSPSMKIIFAAPRYAFEFEQFRQQCNGDERQAMELFRRRHNSNMHGKISNFGLLSEKRTPSDIIPGPGWTKVYVQKGKNKKNLRRWVSPTMKIIFTFPKYALEFEHFRQQCNGDEKQALETFRGRYRNIQSKISNLGLLGWGLNKKKESTPDKVSSSEMQEDTSSSSESEESKELEDSEEESDEYEDSDEEELLDEWGELTSTEIKEYESLYNFYMKPAVRVNEEIAASGMILRKKTATAFLLRSKNSVFRQKLHKKITALEKSGHKDEIYRLLKKMKQFDSSSTSTGDGPGDLLDEILGERNVSGVEIVSSSPVLSSSINLKSDCKMIAARSGNEGVGDGDEVLAQVELKQQPPTDTKTAPKNVQETSISLDESGDNERQGKIDKYSQANVSARIMLDGSVLPVHEAKVLSDGRYKRPVGRGRNGYSWDDTRGRWMPNEDQPPADTKAALKRSSSSTSDELNDIQSPQPVDVKMNSENGVAQTLTSKNSDDTSTPDKTDITNDLKPTSHSKVVSPTDSKMAAVTDDSQQQKQVVDLLDDDDDDVSNEKPSNEETSTELSDDQKQNGKKTDFIDLSGPAEPESNSGAQFECIDLSQIDESVTSSSEVIVID